VYDPAGTSWALQYLAVLFVAGLVVVGAVVHRLLRGRSMPATVAVEASAAAVEA
jgi:hypothetical protein